MPAAVELDDAEKAVLVALLKQTIAADPFPLLQRIRTMRSILAKLEPPPARPKMFPAPKPIGERSHLLEEAGKKAWVRRMTRNIGKIPSFICRRMRLKMIREAVIPKKSLKCLLGAMWNEVADMMLDRYIRAGNHRGYYAQRSYRR